jgi:hypothetical protein
MIKKKIIEMPIIISGTNGPDINPKDNKGVK